MGTICFVVLHYKNFSETDKCIQSILRMKDNLQAQIIVVDNSMNDESGKQVAEKYADQRKILVIPSEEEAGFSRANNIGYSYAKAHYNPDFIIVSNNDIEFCQNDFIERLQKIYERTSFGVMGPDVVQFRTQNHQNPIALKTRTIEEANGTIRKNEIALRHFQLAYPLLVLAEKIWGKNTQNPNIDYGKEMEQVVLFGACLIFSRDFIRSQEKAFFPETNFYYEEYILASRCNREGIKMLYEPSLRVMHESGAATKQSLRNKKERMKFVLKNTMDGCRVYRKYLGDI